MKKIWIVALCLILVLGMAACGQKPDGASPLNGKFMLAHCASPPYTGRAEIIRCTSCA